MSFKKTKKFAAVAMALMLSVALLAGCSPTDTGYWNLYMEMSKLKEYTVTGDFTLDINPDMIGADVGPISVKMVMSGSVALTDKDFYMDLKMKYGINDTKTPNECSMVLAGNGFYMPVKDVADLIAIVLKYSEGYSDKMCADIKAALIKEFPAGAWLALADYGEIFAEAGMADMSLTSIAAGSEAMMEALTGAFQKMFSDLESGMTKKTTDGYSLEITPDNAMAFIDKLVSHISKNKKVIFTEAVKLVKAVAAIYPEGSDIRDTMDEFLGEIEYYEQDFYDALDEMVSYYNDLSDYDKDSAKLLVKGSYIKHSVSKSGSAFTDNYDVLIKVEGEKVFSFKGQQKITPAKVTNKVSVTGDPVGIIAFGETLNKVINKVNHATEIEITWDNGSDYVWMEVTRVEGYDWDSAQSNIENGTMFLPMRQICEWFGEDVEWVQKEKRAYIVRGDKRTDMTGKIVNNRTLVKIRDFEKLGYTVEYTYDKDWKEHKVVITK